MAVNPPFVDLKNATLTRVGRIQVSDLEAVASLPPKRLERLFPLCVR